MKEHYWKISPQKEEWLGKRIFKWDVEQDMIVQVCFVTGESKRGRPSAPSISVISKSTFASNYMMVGYLVPTTKRVFEKEVEKAYNFLINKKVK